ncbi:MAG: putative DNA-binding domain-containing protein, partial [Methylobacteriaceae bacterium]|nr:putative DNA-binding domain-containing protein [Methylobacteriaceae bacterium]
MNRAFAAALLSPGAPAPPGLTTWNGSDPARRFAVYRNNVVVSLIEALSGAFPVTRELVGEEFFRAMAREFALGHPPRSPVMARFGEELPGFIAAFAPARELPWLADVAALEA